MFGMTDAETPCTMGTDCPLLPQREPGRADRIAAIHSMADWFTAHPEVPVPTYVLAEYRLTPVDESDQETRFLAVTQLAERLDAIEYGTHHNGSMPQFDYQIADRRVHGIQIDYRGSAISDQFWGNPF